MCTSQCVFLSSTEVYLIEEFGYWHFMGNQKYSQATYFIVKKTVKLIFTPLFDAFEVSLDVEEGNK